MRYSVRCLARQMVAVAFVFLLRSGALAGPPMVVAYVPNWIDLKTFTDSIDYRKVTHLNVAFENPVNAAGELSFNPDNRFLLTKAQAKGVKVLVSIGGGSASGDAKLKARYAELLSADKRAGFADGLTAYVGKHGFDGLDVDLEGPSIDANYGAFIAALAERLRPAGKLLTAALSKGYGGDKVPSEVLTVFDFVNVMAYDGSGYWQPDAPGPHASYAFAVENVEYWLGRGLPKARTVLGVPFYGYGFGAAFKKRDYPYQQIVKDFSGAEERDVSGTTIYYNGRPTIRRKCQYVRDQGLAGVMIWSLDGDAPEEKSLLRVIHQTLKPGS